MRFVFFCAPFDELCIFSSMHTLFVSKFNRYHSKHFFFWRLFIPDCFSFGEGIVREKEQKINCFLLFYECRLYWNEENTIKCFEIFWKFRYFFMYRVLPRKRIFQIEITQRFFSWTMFYYIETKIVPFNLFKVPSTSYLE